MKVAGNRAVNHDFCDDDPRVFATHLLELHGYEKAMETVTSYIDASRNDVHRKEWQHIAHELDRLRNSTTSSD